MQFEPSNFAILKIPVNHPRRTVWEAVLASLQPGLKSVTFDFQWSVESQSILIHTLQLGLIGSINLDQGTTARTEIQFALSPYPTLQETEQAESAIRSEILENRRLLADIYDSREKVLQILAEYLEKHKQGLLLEIRNWLAYALGIWGLTQERSVPTDFNFLIDGTPAQFGVMLRHFFPTYRPSDDTDRVTVVVTKPEGFELREIPADINPILVNIYSGRSQIGIISHTTPNRSSLLRVSLYGDANSWHLWDVIRQEMERLTWFHFPEVPSQLLEDQTKHGSNPSNQQSGANLEPWLLTPDTGNNRQIVRLWYEQCTCKEISSKVGGTEKTILNRINLLRKQFGPEIVPYRKAIPEKNSGSGD